VTNPTPLRITPLPVGRRASGFVQVVAVATYPAGGRVGAETGMGPRV
jgi:hypothetical protein